MVLKQIALTQEENDILYDLVLHEIRHAQVYGGNTDMVTVTRALLRLYDQFDKFDPPKRLRTFESKKETKPKPAYKPARQSGKRDL